MDIVSNVTRKKLTKMHTSLIKNMRYINDIVNKLYAKYDPKMVSKMVTLIKAQLDHIKSFQNEYNEYLLTIHYINVDKLECGSFNMDHQMDIMIINMINSNCCIEKYRIYIERIISNLQCDS